MKVFYFTKHHAAEQLAKLVQEQLGISSDPQGATNQLVVYCKDHTQADQVLAYLEKIDVPPLQVNIDCLILERFGDVTMDWETSVFIENFMGEDLTLGEKLATFFYGANGDGTYSGIKNGDIFKLDPADYPGISLDALQGGELLDLDPAFPGASLRETERANFGADFGYWMDKHTPGHQVRTVVDMLISRGYLKILLNPTLETVNGKEATVTIRDYTPIEKVKTGLGGASDAYNITEYVWVEDTLTVVPVVYADGMIGLTTNIKIGSRSKPEGVVQRSIITERAIDVEENRIRPGESLVIGGMRKSERRSVIRGIPFFKDLPLIRVLFSSKDFEEKGTEIIFILTPSISSGGQENPAVVRKIRKKYEKARNKMGLGKMLTEPFGDGSYTRVVEKEAAETEEARIRAEAEKEEIQQRLAEEKKKAGEAQKEAERLRRQANELQKKAEQTQVQARQAQEAEKATQQQRQAEQSRAEELSKQAAQAVEEARKVQAEAQEAERQAAEAQSRARQQAERVRKAEEEVKQSQRALEKAGSESNAEEPDAQSNPTEEPAADEPGPVPGNSGG